ncbi:MAG: CPBP family intramembrane metalloprotease [Aliifodinibius sp.]|nr:CPBP family intramembrane metalloprotease [Fodinibius sp.]NIV14238.1 CPBP family intramembrane metalloprotease [Fodinibius sp.]NIY28072.1 CPBP family intramembrane metalloprotease [Fodinibius sp.]
MKINQNLLIPSLRTKKSLIAIELLIFIIINLAWVIIEIPRSIIPFFLFCWASLRLRAMSWQKLGLRMPNHLIRTILFGICLGSLIQIIGLTLIRPLLDRYFGITSIDPRDFSLLTVSVPLFVLVLLGQWLLAGLGEEAVFRGYLLNRITDLVGGGTLGLLTSIVVSSTLFSFFHGLIGMPFFVLTFIIGVIYSLVYILTGRNLWFTIIAHGTANTIGFGLAFLR